MIQTGADLSQARRKMGLSLGELADLLRLGGSTERGAQRLREIERGKIPLSGPLAIATELLLERFLTEGSPQ